MRENILNFGKINHRGLEMKKILKFIAAAIVIVSAFACKKDEPVDPIIGNFHFTGVETTVWGDEAPKKIEIEGQLRFFNANDGNIRTSGIFATVCHHDGDDVTFDNFVLPGARFETTVYPTKFLDGKMTILLQEEGDIEISEGSNVHYRRQLTGTATKSNL